METAKRYIHKPTRVFEDALDIVYYLLQFVIIWLFKSTLR